MKKIIIIGAGPAGLTAAYKLLENKKEYEVIILEEDTRVGGISKTVNVNGNRMDLGGHRFFSKDENIMNFWKELMPIQASPSFDDKKLEREKNLFKGGPDPEKNNEVMLLRNRVSRIYYLRKFFDYPVSLKKETLKNMGLSRTVKVGISYLKSTVIKKKEDSLENFYINRFGKVLYSMFFEKYTEKVWGRSPKQISADWGAQRVKGVSIKAVVKDMLSKKFNRKNKEVETSLIEEFWYPKYGPGQLWELLAKRIEQMGGRILKGYKVEKINTKNCKIVSVECSNQQQIEGDIFISSMPLKDLVLGFQGEKLPNKIRNIANGLPYRDFMTVGVLVNKLKIKNETSIKTKNNLIPDCWIYVQEPDVKMGRIQIFNNWSPYLVSNPENTVWIGLEYFVTENDKFWNMKDVDFSNFAIDELVKMAIIEKEDVLDTHVERIKKAYPAYFDTYSEIDKLIKYLDKYNNLYCIGRNGQHRYNNMDHSMLTGMEAAKNIEGDIPNKENIWSINTEKEYHEEKK